MNERIADKKLEWKERYNERTVNCRGSRDQVSSPYLEGAGQHLIISHQQLTMRQWEDNIRAGTEMPGWREHWEQHSGHSKVVTCFSSCWNPMAAKYCLDYWVAELLLRSLMWMVWVVRIGDLVTTNGKRRQVLRLTFRKSKWVVETDWAKSLWKKEGLFRELFL